MAENGSVLFPTQATTETRAGRNECADPVPRQIYKLCGQNDSGRDNNTMMMVTMRNYS